MNQEDPIVQNGDPVLRKIAREIAPELIGGKTLTAEIQHMKDVLRREFDGVAIAAPQVGISKRLFVLSGKLFGPGADDVACINPTIVKTSQKTALMDEGCLSVRYTYGNVKRHLNITLEYTDESGRLKSRGAGGLLAHVIQHEMDHLEGILFIDKAHSCEELKGRDKKQLDMERNKHILDLDD